MDFFTFARDNALREFSHMDTVPAPPTIQPDMAGVIRRSLALNDAQWANQEIDHAVWSDTYIALLNYATRHGIAEDVLR